MSYDPVPEALLSPLLRLAVAPLDGLGDSVPMALQLASQSGQKHQVQKQGED